MVAEAAIETGPTCAKCGHVNPRRARNHCRKCGAHLRVACRNCGQGNERAASVCSACGAALHRKRWDRFLGWARRRIGLTGVSIALVTVALMVWGTLHVRHASREARSPSAAPEKLSPDELLKKYRH